MRWTDEQWAAIEAPKQGTVDSQSILVAAAAGSGKTAVLVERIIRKLQDKEKPTAINELVVLTFTKAAAEEMKGRIAAKLAEVYEETQDPYLEKQLQLLPSAQISTLHSFCTNVIHNYFYKLENVDPTARIGNAGEIGLLKSDVLDALVEKAYEEDLYHVYELADIFSKKPNDYALQNCILQLYDFATSLPDPKGWLRSLQREMGSFGSDVEEPVEKIEDTPWGKYYLDWFSNWREEYTTKYTELCELMEQPLAPLRLDSHVKELELNYDGFSEPLSWDDVSIVQKKHQGSWSRMPGNAKDLKDPTQTDPALLAQVKSLIDELRAYRATLKKMPFNVEGASWHKQLQKQVPLIEGLCEMTIAFIEAFQEAKQKEGLLDFNDLEHYCLDILTEPNSLEETGHREPSVIAKELQASFKEVMVDEYQDTNGVQEAIVNLISRGDNCFYVGDVKQSIYSFRKADPGLFLTKYESYSEEEAEKTRRIDLAKNFRSHWNVLAATNYIFAQIMTKEAAQLDYGEKEALYAGRIVEDAPEEYVGGNVEVIIIEKTKQSSQEEEAGDEEVGEELAGHELEMNRIAQEIWKLKENNTMVQDKDGSFRPMRWSDIVILVRSISSKGPEMVDQFRSQQIPVYIEEKSGYFQSMEVKLMLSLLHCIDNPDQNLPMAAVLRSPLVDVNSNTIAAVRNYTNELFGKDASLWTGLLHLAAKEKGEEPEIQHHYAIELNAWREEDEEGNEIIPGDNRDEVVFTLEDEVQKSRLLTFVERMQEWRTLSRRKTVSDLLWHIFEETACVEYVSAMTNGRVRRANVLALYDRAKDYESGNFRGLYKFLRFLASLEEAGEDLPLAKTVGEGDDVVRIMTVHKSKGLEFPIVFLAGANKQFNAQDTKNTLLIHKDGGLGIKGYMPEFNLYYPSLPWLYMKDLIDRDRKAEEERLLYVAMTRAKDKLYIIGTISSEINKYLSHFQRAAATPNDALPTPLILEGKSYLDWVVMALLRHLHGGKLRQSIEQDGDYYRKLPYGDSRWQIHIEKADAVEGDGEEQSYTLIDYEKAYEDESLYRFNDQLYMSEEDAQIEADATIERLTTLGVTENLPTVEKVEKEALSERLIDRLHAVYPYEASTMTAAKTTVTEFKRRFSVKEEVSQYPHVHVEKSEETKLYPVFATEPSWEEAEEKQNHGASYGTLMHTVMEHLPATTYTKESLEKALEDMVHDGQISEADKNIVSRNAICAFFDSELGQRMLQAKTVHREFSFSVLLEGADYEPNLEAGEKLFMQGVMDLLFLEVGQWVLVDYKTDRLSSEKAFIQRYMVQLGLYSDALEQLTGIPVKETYIYSFRLGKAILVDTSTWHDQRKAKLLTAPLTE